MFKGTWFDIQDEVVGWKSKSKIQFIRLISLNVQNNFIRYSMVTTGTQIFSVRSKQNILQRKLCLGYGTNMRRSFDNKMSKSGGKNLTKLDHAPLKPGMKWFLKQLIKFH